MPYNPVEQSRSGPGTVESGQWLRYLRVLLAAALIVAAGLLAYGNSFQGPFIFDDTTSIPDNTSIRHLWPIWQVFSAQPGATVAGRPVLSLSLAMNYRISGLEVWSYHLVNMIIHILAGLVLFGIIRRTLLTQDLKERYSRAATGLASICALIWVVHPLQTGAVTYIVQRAESLMGLFYLLSLYCAIRGFYSAKSRRWYAGAIASCALGVGTKEVAATAPLMILLYDRIFIGRPFRKIFTERRGLYAGLAASWVIFIALALSAPRGSSVGFGRTELVVWQYILTQCKVIVLYYLKLALWPTRLVFDYGWPIPESYAEVAPYAAVLLGLLAATVAALWKRPQLGFLGGWFFVILGPTSSFLPLLTEAAAEHRMYLPLAAVVVGLVFCGHALGGHLLRRFAIRPALVAALGYILAAAVIVVLGLLTVQRNHDYRTKLSIWNDTVSKQPDNWRAWNNRGLAHEERGDFRHAIHDFDRAIRINPEYAESYNNRGLIFGRMGEFDLAIRDFDKAIELNPEYAESYNNRGLLYGSKGEHDLAIRDFGRAIELKPGNAGIYANRGIVYVGKGDLDRALRDFSMAVRLDPGDARHYSNRGTAYMENGDFTRAVDDFEKALELDPGDVMAQRNLGRARERLERTR